MTRGVQPAHSPEWLAAREEYMRDRGPGESPGAALARRVRATGRMWELEELEETAKAGPTRPAPTIATTGEAASSARRN